MPEIVTRVNNSLPTGTKFFPVEDATSQKKYQKTLSRDFITTMQKAADLLKRSSLNCENFKVITPLRGWNILTDGEYPKVKVNWHAFPCIENNHSVITSTRKAQYGSNKRIGGLDIPTVGETALIRWDPIKKGIWVYNSPYEGELVNNKPRVVSNNLEYSILEEVRTIAVLNLIDPEASNKIPYAYSYCSKAVEASHLDTLIPKVLTGTSTTEEVIGVAYMLGFYGRIYESGVGNVLDTSKELKASFKIPAYARARWVYMYGGYTLPDNYEEFFDVE